MSNNRLLGQDVTLSLSNPNGPQESLGEIKSFEWTVDIELLQEMYLGKKADSYDEIFHGYKGSAEFDINSKAWFRFEQIRVDRAQRRTPAAGKFSLTARFTFPDGESVRLIFQDIKFGNSPGSVGGRAQYANGKVEWGCDTCRRLL